MVNKEFTLKDAIPSTLASLLLLCQIVCGIYFLPTISQNDLVAYCGVTIYFFSGFIFGLLPVFEFRKKGEVKTGKSYIHTTKLVDTGIYSIVRHPQYITFILWAIAGMLLFQQWIVVSLGIPIIPLIYIDLINADKDGTKKFGEAYKRYMKQVPRANFLLGIVRIVYKISK